MAIVSSFGTVTAISGSTPLMLSSAATSGPFYDGYRRTYAQIYQTQPAVRTVIDFFARNIAQLGLQAYRRVSDTDRVRLTAGDHQLPATLGKPNYATTRYRFIESTVQDIGIYANAYWLKVRANQLGLVRVPAGEVSVVGGLLPTEYLWQPRLGQGPQYFGPSEIVHFRLFDPANPVIGFPPLETLRQVLAEATAAGAYREQFWKNSGRFETVIERPATAPRWEDTQREQFRTEWQEFAGQGAKAGKTPVLEDGMSLKPISFNAKESQYTEGLKLTREFVAAQFHVPLPMVGILDHATFSNIREQHKQLYQDCLGPWLTMLEEEMELQLVPEFEDVENVYLEFNIAEKMKGSFEEQADSLARAVGRPYMTANEARARLNLPRHENPTADDLADVAPGQGATFGGGSHQPPSGMALKFRALLEKFAARQSARIEKDAPEEQAATFNHGRWTTELADDLRSGCGAEFCSVWGEDADRVASLINSETWARLETLQPPWSTGRINAVQSRFMEAL